MQSFDIQIYPIFGNWHMYILFIIQIRLTLKSDNDKYIVEDSVQP